MIMIPVKKDLFFKLKSTELKEVCIPINRFLYSRIKNRISGKSYDKLIQHLEVPINDVVVFTKGKLNSNESIYTECSVKVDKPPENFKSSSLCFYFSIKNFVKDNR